MMIDIIHQAIDIQETVIIAIDILMMITTVADITVIEDTAADMKEEMIITEHAMVQSIPSLRLMSLHLIRTQIQFKHICIVLKVMLNSNSRWTWN